MTERKPSKAQLMVLRHLAEGARLDTWLGDGRMWTVHEAMPVKLSTVVAMRKRYWIRKLNTRARNKGDRCCWIITRKGRDVVTDATGG